MVGRRHIRRLRSPRHCVLCFYEYLVRRGGICRICTKGNIKSCHEHIQISTQRVMLFKHRQVENVKILQFLDHNQGSTDKNGTSHAQSACERDGLVQLAEAVVDDVCQ